MPMLESLESRVHLTAVTGDTTFGKAGTARLDFYVPRGQRAYANQAVVDNAGRTYVVARLIEVDRGYDGATRSYQIERLTTNGKPDTAWAVGKGGRLKFDWTGRGVVGNSYNDHPERFRVAIDPSDRLLVLDGTSVRRFDSRGRPDRSFGNRGTAVLTGFRQTADLTTDSAGRPLVVGTAPRAHLPRLGVARLTTGGDFDAKFARNGVYVAPEFGSIAHPDGYGDGQQTSGIDGEFLRVLDDGSVIAAGGGISKINVPAPEFTGGFDEEWDDGVQAVKLTARGRPDRSYGVAGFAESLGYTYFNTANTAVVGIRPDGAVVASSYFDTQNASGGDDFFDFNNLLKPDQTGRVTDDTILELTPTKPGTYPNAAVFVDFIGPASGPYLTLADGKVFRQSARGKFDQTFNDGKLLAAGAIDAGPQGTLITADVGRSTDELIVRRFIV